MEELKLPITRGSVFGVTMGVVTTVEGEGICGRTELKLLKITIHVKFLAINLGKRDVVAGITWLCSTGLMGIHWPPKSFAIKNQPIVLRGNSTLTTVECSLRSLMKVGKEEEQGS